MIFDRFGKCGFANSIKDAAVLRKQQDERECYVAQHAGGTRQIARARLKGENAELQRAWYRGQVAKYFSFNEATLSAASYLASYQASAEAGNAFGFVSHWSHLTSRCPPSCCADNFRHHVAVTATPLSTQAVIAVPT